ncbi:uncharacterized protein RCC_04301 [Ramularia collo-cygni]|uniref:AB hydrolase-1 domain-containing protein n=1 Tax=Ramularia collo-cygni TaxID=112498 RepID=A0A2D3V4K0_9PEZI|nr:uncharacterized protein RCC_04301 [Ramularia collo-cygni]CZT18456.1 uncharacterized protein RCC_04301 [Ramularia collo-cygni]
MINNIITTFAGLSAVAQAATAGHRAGPKCTDFLIPVHASSSKMVPAGNIPDGMAKPEVLVDYLLSQATSSLIAGPLGAIGSVEQSGDFEMSARYCEPAVHVASRAHTIQYLQHAITSGKDYWNGVTYPVGFAGDMYSYSKAASDNGYATIALDNLGSGNSSHPDPVAVVQMALQAQIAHEIITMLREGKVQGPVAGKTFNKVIYVGHSYGSIMGNAIAATFPDDVNAFVLTGYTGEFVAGAPPLLSGVAVPAALAMPKFADLPVGYLAQTYEPGRLYAFYTVDNVGGFDPAMPQYDFDNQGTVALGELATLFYGLTPAKEFTGSVFVVTGHQDAIVCNNLGGADCYKPANKLDAAKGFWPAAKDYSYIIPEKTGHAANLHYSSPESFKKVHAYLASQGL